MVTGQNGKMVHGVDIGHKKLHIQTSSAYTRVMPIVASAISEHAPDIHNADLASSKSPFLIFRKIALPGLGLHGKSVEKHILGPTASNKQR